MADRHGQGGNSGMDADRQRRLWNHIKALEVLAAQKQEIVDDEKERKLIAKNDGFDLNIMGVILKRRKAGEGMTLAADSLLELYEAALRDQGALPLEATRKPPEADARRPIEKVSEDLHGADQMFDPISDED